MIRRRTRVLVRDAVGAAVAVVVVAGLAFGGWRVAGLVGSRHEAPASVHTSATTKPAAPGGTVSSKSVPSAPPAPALGLYTGPGAAPTASAVDATIGGKVTYVLDFQPAGSWQKLSDPSWLAQSWASTPFRLVVAVPMLPASGGTLAQGAAGAYDGYFTLLAQRMVANGIGSAILMVGWQPESSQYPWQVSTAAQAAQYVTFWDRIHAAMAAVPGANFEFEWDIGLPGTQLTPGSLYPGNGAVDLVAEDAFDVGLGPAAPGDQWTALLAKPYGPTWAARFAAARGKQLALGMCGLAPASAGGGGDNAAFLTSVLKWARSAHAALVVVWDYGSWAVTGQGFPQADAALVQAADQGLVGVSGSGAA